MPDNNDKEKDKDKDEEELKKRNKNILSNIDDIMNRMELSLYGTTKKNDINELLGEFNTIIKTQTDGLAHAQDGEISSFISRVYDNDKKKDWTTPNLEAYLNSDDSNIVTFMSNAYKNKVLKYSDLKEVSNQLIELKEAVFVMRDAIVSPDLTSGSISKKFNFEYMNDADKATAESSLKKMEDKFKLNKLIKNHIVPKTLIYGKYYAYVIPYSKIFTDFALKTKDPIKGQNFISDAIHYTESASISQFLTEGAKNSNEAKIKKDTFLKECVDDYMTQFTNYEIENAVNIKTGKYMKESEFKEEVKKEISFFMDNISVNNSEVPLPFLSEGVDGLMKLSEILPFTQTTNKSNMDFFTEAIDELTIANDPKSVNNYNNAKEELEKEFSQISDCYIKLGDPMHWFPIKILQSTIGYIYIEEEDINMVNGIVTSADFYNKYNTDGKQKTIIDKLVNLVVNSFDKDFLKENKNFKKLIADCLMYYDLGKKKIRFQYIPAEYVCEFKINEDEEGEGTSILEGSLFYAKLYLLLLLFKITSIILYSNDTKVNYIKTSGVDKDITKKIQRIARDKQNHQINIMDLMSYTTLLRKIGNGTEMYIPTGRSGERGFETEVLQGQDVQFNNELMELLRNSYILGTGVPAAIINYLNETDFAKSIETANTKWLGRIMSCQIDFNESITDFYRRVAKYSNAFNQNYNEVNFSITLTPPKFANNLIKNDAMSTFTSIKDFVLSTLLGDQWQNDESKQKTAQFLVKKLVNKFLPDIGIDEAEDWLKEVEFEIEKDKLNPQNKNTENIDNFDLDKI